MGTSPRAIGLGGLDGLESDRDPGRPLLSSKGPDLAGTHITHAVTLVTSMVDPALGQPHPHRTGAQVAPQQGWTQPTPDTAGAQGVDLAHRGTPDGRTVHLRTHTRHGILTRTTTDIHASPDPGRRPPGQ